MNKTLIHLALLGLTANAPAETRLSETVVTASRLDEPVERSPYATTVVTRQQIERSGALDVSQILATLPGVQIGRNGGAGQATSIFLRGTASDQVLVLIDGVPVQSATTGAAAIQHIDPAVIERIEVVRGPASTLYGSGAIGGVIQIFTRRPHGRRPTGHASLSAGNENTQTLSAGVSGGQGVLSARLDLSHQQTDGYPPKRGSNLSRGYRHDTFDLAVDYALSPDVQVELGHWQSQGNVEYLDFFNNPADQDVRNSLSHLTLDMAHGDAWSSRLRLARAVDNSDENQSADYAHTERDELDWQHDWELNAHHTLVGGLTLNREQARLSSFGTGYDKTSRSKALYLQDRYRNGPVTLQAGARALDHSVYGGQVTWSLGAGYQLDADTHLHANAGTAFRSPSANDLYGFGGNPNFKPERSRSFEIGLRRRLSANQSLALNLFHTRVRDLIEADPLTFTVQQIERARIRGVELGHRWHAGPWSTTIDYTWLDARNLDLDSRLPRRAENKLDAEIRYDAGAWWGQTVVTAESERRDSRFSNRTLAPYATVDLAAGYRLGKDWSTELHVTNLLDKDYELAGGYPAQGRLVMLGLRYAPR